MQGSNLPAKERLIELVHGENDKRERKKVQWVVMLMVRTSRMMSRARLGSRSKYPIRPMILSHTSRERSSMDAALSTGLPSCGECEGPKELITSTHSLL